ncbi:putative retrotransposon ty1-copia subclass protein, partial [Tanacetum coccineum]
MCMRGFVAFSGTLVLITLRLSECTDSILNSRTYFSDASRDRILSWIYPIQLSFNKLSKICQEGVNKEHELGDLSEPANYKAALKDLESKKWLVAMNVEMQSMKDNDVWELVELPPNAKTVGHKWIFKKKTNMDGALHTFKSHLVAKGFTQTYGVDFKENFSPIADMRAIRNLIA